MRRQIEKARLSLSSLLSPDVTSRRGSLAVPVADRPPSGVESAQRSLMSSPNAKSPTPDVCLLIDSPVRPLKMAAAGKVSELKALLARSPHLQSAKDDSGRSLMHVAAENNHTKVMDLLHSLSLAVNDADDDGNTPLHLAMLHDCKDAVQFLLRVGADSKLLNHDLKAPIHVACAHNCADSLTSLLRERPEDVELTGERGFTPGHYCAVADSADAYDAMTRLNCVPPCKGDWTGMYPIHLAIKNLSVRFFSVLVRNTEVGCGVGARALMNMRDVEGNVALHTAVNTGDERSVMLCLDHEADIDVQQVDDSTPVHHACTKGELDLVRLMMLKRTEQFGRVLGIKDNNGRTPLHKAAFFDHTDVTRFLIEQGADIEATDDFHRTPLLLAAYKNAISVCHVLMEHGADCTKTDVNGRNVFHLLVLGGGSSCAKTKTLPRFECLRRLVNDRDVYGCSPLHYATKRGLITSTDTFLGMGADCFVQNNEDDTPLHFAARYGRINTCQKLLDSGNCSRVLNCMDSKGYLPIHAAAENGHSKTLQLLLDRGSIFQKTFEGDTPLHLAADNGHLGTVEMLLRIQPSLMNGVNKAGKTALHLAAESGKAEVVDYLLTRGADILFDCEGHSFILLAIHKGHIDVAKTVVKHERWQELLLTVNERQHSGCFEAKVYVKCPVHACVEEMPDVAVLALDRCCWDTNDYKSHDYHINYDFAILTGRSVEQHLKIPPLGPLKLMVDLNRVELLQHPVCQAYLTYKWYSYGKFIHLTNILVYLMFIIFLTLHVMWMEPHRHVDTADCSVKFSATSFQMTSIIVLAVAVSVNIMKEFVQMYQQRWKYFADVSNYFEWTLYLCVAVSIYPNFLTESLHHFQVEASAVAMFFAYLNLLLFFKRFEMFGIYVVMFIEISQTLAKALSLFVILILGFSFSFYVLLKYPFTRGPETSWLACYPEANTTSTDTALYAWSTPTLAVVKTFMMMMGEFDYLSTFIATMFDGDRLTNHFNVVAFGVLLLFVFFIPILLMNLLIGLAVGDIESVRKNATLKRIAMQVDWYVELEEKMPVFIRRSLYTTKFVSYPNCAIRTWMHVNTGLRALLSYVRCRRCARNTHPAREDEKEEEEEEADPAGRCTLLDRRNDACENRFEMILNRHANRVSKLEGQLETQTKLLKLIIQKMEIHTEAEERDEGTDLRHQDEAMPVQVASKWKKLQAIKKMRVLRADHARPLSPSNTSTTLV